MSFNYASERNKFDTAWEKLRKEYAFAGMSPESIEVMYQYDLQQFNTDRAYTKRNCPLNLSYEQMDENDDFENFFLENHLEQFTTQYDTYGTHSRYWWLSEIESPVLEAELIKLSEDDKELLTLIFVDGYTQEECSVKLHITQRAVSYRIKSILSKFTKK